MVLPPMKSVKVIDIDELSNYITDMAGYSIEAHEIITALEITGTGYFEVKRSDILAFWEKAEINRYPSVTIIVITSINIIFSQMISDEMFLLQI